MKKALRVHKLKSRAVSLYVQSYPQHTKLLSQYSIIAFDSYYTCMQEAKFCGIHIILGNPLAQW